MHSNTLIMNAVDSVKKCLSSLPGWQHVTDQVMRGACQSTFLLGRRSKAEDGISSPDATGAIFLQQDGDCWQDTGLVFPSAIATPVTNNI
ncbi:hypothetical protein E2C01_047465 [Portunus trituberculatus]|uniref:Uncharacterized protein n=1 Tax=Portunus trituberculatus TaxID=210409 RepID=A0A5B7G0H7_PORTR|nr:hypothetical protein [Portunus trituberculatus]